MPVAAFIAYRTGEAKDYFLILVAMFAARFVVQQELYTEDSAGWLAFTRIAMGYPLLGLALLAVPWAVHRSTRRLKAQAGATRPPADAQHGLGGPTPGHG